MFGDNRRIKKAIKKARQGCSETAFENINTKPLGLALRVGAAISTGGVSEAFLMAKRRGKV